MDLRRLAAAGLIAASTLTAMPASAAEPLTGGASIQLAQGGYEWEHDWEDRRRLSPRELRRALRHQGFHDIEILDRGRRTYTVRAENHRGRDFILRVSARTGLVVSARPVRRWADGGWDSPRHDDRERCWLPEGCY
jgi:hypothetical protein